MRSRALAILLSLAFLPVAQAMCAAGLCCGDCACEVERGCGDDCGCTCEAAPSVVLESTVSGRTVLADSAPMLPLPCPVIDHHADLFAVRAPDATRLRDFLRCLPFPISDVPLLM